MANGAIEKAKKHGGNLLKTGFGGWVEQMGDSIISTTLRRLGVSAVVSALGATLLNLLGGHGWVVATGGALFAILSFIAVKSHSATIALKKEFSLLLSELKSTDEQKAQPAITTEAPLEQPVTPVTPHREERIYLREQSPKEVME